MRNLLALLLVTLWPATAYAQLDGLVTTVNDATVASASVHNDNWAIFADALDRTGGTMTGNLIFSLDNTLDIGASGTTRPRDLYLARDAVIGGDLTLTGSFTLGEDLLFSADNTYDIGAAADSRPRDVFVADDVVIGDDLTVTDVASFGDLITASGGLWSAAAVTIDSTTATLELFSDDTGGSEDGFAWELASDDLTFYNYDAGTASTVMAFEDGFEGFRLEEGPVLGTAGGIGWIDAGTNIGTAGIGFNEYASNDGGLLILQAHDNGTNTQDAFMYLSGGDNSAVSAYLQVSVESGDFFFDNDEFYFNSSTGGDTIFEGKWATGVSSPQAGTPAGAYGTGNTTGSTLYAGNNTNGNGAAGVLQLNDTNSQGRFIWIDAVADVRTGTALPEEDGTPSDTSGTVIGTQSSAKIYKENIRSWNDPQAALETILHTGLYEWDWKSGAYPGSVNRGVILDWAPTEFGQDISVAEGAPKGKSLNEATVIAYLIASIQQLNAELDELREKVGQ